jgi:hypothetical protein
VQVEKDQLARLNLWVRIARCCDTCGQYSIVTPTEDAKELPCVCGGQQELLGVYMDPNGFDR